MNTHFVEVNWREKKGSINLAYGHPAFVAAWLIGGALLDEYQSRKSIKFPPMTWDEAVAKKQELDNHPDIIATHAIVSIKSVEDAPKSNILGMIVAILVGFGLILLLMSCIDTRSLVQVK
jgi:hypothetical protein